MAQVGSSPVKGEIPLKWTLSQSYSYEMPLQVCQFLQMSRTKRSFWKVSLSVFANVSYETLLLEGLFVSFCECLVRNAHFGRKLHSFFLDANSM